MRELIGLREDAIGLVRDQARAAWLRAAGLPEGPPVAARIKEHPLASSGDGLAQAREALEDAQGDPDKTDRAARLASLRDFLVRAVAQALDPGVAEELALLPARPSVRPPGDAGLHGALPPLVVDRDLPLVRERQRRGELCRALGEALSQESSVRGAAFEAAQAALLEAKLGNPPQAAAALQSRGWANPASNSSGGLGGAANPAGAAEALASVRAACERVLTGTEALANDLYAWLLERHAGVRRFPGGAESHDVLSLLHAPRCAGAFPRGEQLRTCRRWAEMLRLDLNAGGAVKLDDDERPLKPAGAAAVAIDPPELIRIYLFPAEGPRALAGLLSALGTAQLLAGPPGDAPPEDLWLGDAALPHAAGELFAGLARDPIFLRRCARADLKRDDERAIAIASVIDARLLAAQTLGALEAHQSGLGARAEEAYRDLFARAALAELPAGLALRELDPFLGAWAHLRGLAFAARARAFLRDRFDEDWFRNPRALSTFHALWGRGGRPTLRELWLELSGAPNAPPEEPSVEPLLRELTEACG